MFTTGKCISAVDPSRLMTYLRWRVQLPVHGGPRSAALQLPTQTLPLQVNILVWVLLLCGDEVRFQYKSVVKLTTVHEQRMFSTEDRRGCGVKKGKEGAVKGVGDTRGPLYG